MARLPEMDQFEVEDALRTLKRAEEIQGNKKLMGKVKKEAEKQVKAIQKVAKKVANKTSKSRKKK